MRGLRRLSLIGLCTLMAGSAVLHFLIPGPYRGIVPVPLRPHAALIVASSGVAELICAGLLAMSRTRRVGALCTAFLLVVVFPANVQMAWDNRDESYAVLTWLRLPLQVPLVLWALSLRRERAR